MARWTILSSRAATASGRCRPSGLGMYTRRDGNARYAPLCTRSCRFARFLSRSASKVPHVSPSTPGAAFRFNSLNASRSRSVLMWWSSAVNLSFFLCLAACRMRSSACDTLARSCARYVLCRLAFPLVPVLGSASSAADCSALFVGFTATTTGSDSPPPFIIGFGSSPSRCGPLGGGRTWGLPVPVQGASAHARVSDHAEGPRRSRYRARSCCLPLFVKRRLLGAWIFRGSMAGLCAPLPTLHCRPCGRQRTARGRCGSLLLHRNGLAPSTPCRSPGAHEAIPAAPGASSVLEHERRHQFGHGCDAERSASWHDRQRVDWPTLRRRHTEVPDATVAIAVSREGEIYLLSRSHEARNEHATALDVDRPCSEERGKLLCIDGLGRSCHGRAASGSAGWPRRRSGTLIGSSARSGSFSSKKSSTRVAQYSNSSAVKGRPLGMLCQYSRHV